MFITEYYFRAKVLFITSLKSWNWILNIDVFRLKYKDALFIAPNFIFLRIIAQKNMIIIDQKYVKIVYQNMYVGKNSKYKNISKKSMDLRMGWSGL